MIEQQNGPQLEQQSLLATITPASSSISPIQPRLESGSGASESHRSDFEMLLYSVYKELRAEYANEYDIIVK